jgi:hypothetical protein
MSKHHPECPQYNHDNCKELHNQKVCAIVRKDKTCLKEFSKTRNKAQNKNPSIKKQQKERQHIRKNSENEIEDACLKPSIQATQKWLRFQAEIINPKLLIPAIK